MKRSSTLVNGRQYATSVNGTVITFECARHGHTYTIDWSKKPVAKRMSAMGCALMARWWSREKGGCIGSCPKCAKLAKP